MHLLSSLHLGGAGQATLLPHHQRHPLWGGLLPMARPKMTLCDVEVVHCLDEETACIVLIVGVDGSADTD